MYHQPKRRYNNNNDYAFAAPSQCTEITVEKKYERNENKVNFSLHR